MIQESHEIEATAEHHVCPYHKEHPNENYAGCTCSSVYSAKRVMPWEKKKVSLRPDVLKTVEDLIAVTGLPAQYSDYHYARLRLSQVAGFDAPKELYDQEQYDRALTTWCEACGF